MGEEPEELSRRIDTRDGFASFLDALGNDAIERGSEWENLHIFDMLESMAAWLRDGADGAALSDPQLTPEQWQFIAQLMLAGKHYE
jgi:hypothetical protein